MDARRLCKKCNNQGFYIVQPLTLAELEALAIATPNEPVKTVECRCECGAPDARISREDAKAWNNLYRIKYPKRSRRAPPPPAQGGE